MIAYSRMVVEHAYANDGITLTIKPKNYRERFPDFYEIKQKENGITWEIVPYGIGLERIEIGIIPDGYEVVTKDKYEIVLKTKQRRNIRQKVRGSIKQQS